METKEISKIEQVKDFILDHKKQIAIGCGLALLYSIGYKKGMNKIIKVVNRELKEDIDSGMLKCISASGVEVIPFATLS